MGRWPCCCSRLRAAASSAAWACGSASGNKARPGGAFTHHASCTRGADTRAGTANDARQRYAPLATLAGGADMVCFADSPTRLAALDAASSRPPQADIGSRVYCPLAGEPAS